MAYTVRNYKTKKAMLVDLRDGIKVEVYQPGPFGPDVPDGRVHLEGPHYPEAHKWCAAGMVKNGVLVKAE
jgi:hypothetical protein